jgi:hypothetical protein
MPCCLRKFQLCDSCCGIPAHCCCCMTVPCVCCRGLNWKHPVFGGCTALGAGENCRVVKGWDFVGETVSGRYRPDSDPVSRLLASTPCNSNSSSNTGALASKATAAEHTQPMHVNILQAVVACACCSQLGSWQTLLQWLCGQLRCSTAHYTCLIEGIFMKSSTSALSKRSSPWLLLISQMDCLAHEASHGTQVASVAAGDASYNDGRPW